MACNSPSTDNVVKARVLMLRRADPNLSYSVLAQRTGAGERTIRRWLNEAGLGQGQRTEDARGQTPAKPDEARRARRGSGVSRLSRGALDALGEFQEGGDDSTSARPRNEVVPESCPESL
jgi:transposase-like protein